MNTRISRIGLHVTRAQVIGGSLLGLLLAAGIASAVHYTPPLLAGPALTQLVITGRLAHVPPQAVQGAVRSALGSGFFTTHVDAVRNAVAALPWVASAAVRRSWPHTLYVEVTEEQPVVRWNGNGLMDAGGRVFVHSDDSAWVQLPVLNGPQGSEADLLAEYYTFAALLAPHALVLRQLTVDARGDASLQLGNGLEVRLGRENAELRLERFVSVSLPTLASQLASVAYVDMRYTNGFAVGYCGRAGGTLATANTRPGNRAGDAAMDGSPGPLTQQDAERSGAAGQRITDGSQPCAPVTEVKPNG
ncbi:MAG: cell division protein FtsQ/DivIB [Gammaproteobacteria bacterium]